MVQTYFLDVVDLALRVRQRVRLRAQRHAPLDPQVAQPAYPADGDLLAWADARAHKGRVGRDARAEEGCRVCGGEGVWNLEGVVLVCADVGGVPSVGLAAACFLWILGVVRILK